MHEKPIIWIFGLISLMLFVAPIAIYINQFGIGVWNDHTKWAEMGSAFSGIYSPIIAFLAAVILIGQAISQVSINKHQFDQSHIQQARDDINFYLERLETYLDEPVYPEGTARSVLQKFALIEEKELRNEKCRTIAEQFITKNRKIFNYWVALDPLLRSLNITERYPYHHNYVSSRLKTIVVLSLESCIALDKIHFSSDSELVKSQMLFWTEKR